MHNKTYYSFHFEYLFRIHKTEIVEISSFFLQIILNPVVETVYFCTSGFTNKNVFEPTCVQVSSVGGTRVKIKPDFS